MAYTLEDYKAARDAFVGRLMMPKLAGDLSDSFRRRDDRIALEALELMVQINTVGKSKMAAQYCPVCGAEVFISAQKFCWNCGRAL